MENVCKLSIYKQVSFIKIIYLSLIFLLFLSNICVQLDYLDECTADL